MYTLQQWTLYDEDEFFNSHICHVCKTEYNENFITCDQCHMISYCSIDHRLKHTEHMQICEVMQKLLKSHPQFGLTFDVNLKKWVELRKEFLRLTTLELQRDLKPCEVKMITLAKSCFICHQQTSLNTCMKCYSVHYCPNHADHLESHYISGCTELKLCLQVDIQLSITYLAKKLQFTSFPHQNKPLVDMDTFIAQYVSPCKSLSPNKFAIECFYSDYASGPLTLYYGLQKIYTLNFLNEFRSSYVIHIIANSFDIEYLSAWDLFLQLLPNIRHLEIVLIKPILRIEHKKIEVCRAKCINQFKNKQLSFESHSMLYHNYIDSKEYKPPNVIIGFQVDFSDWEDLLETIFRVQKQDCPFLLTAKSKLKAEQNISKIEEVLEILLFNMTHIVYDGENEFNSRRPYRDFENGGVSYRNKYLTVYKKL